MFHAVRNYWTDFLRTCEFCFVYLCGFAKKAKAVKLLLVVCERLYWTTWYAKNNILHYKEDTTLAEIEEAEADKFIATLLPQYTKL